MRFSSDCGGVGGRDDLQLLLSLEELTSAGRPTVRTPAWCVHESAEINAITWIGGLYTCQVKVRVKSQNVVFSRLGTRGRRIQLILAQTRPKYSQRCGEGTTWVRGPMPILSKGQCQVTKGNDNQKSHLNSVTQVFRAILAIEVNGGIRSIVRSHFWTIIWKIMSRSGHKRSIFQIDQSHPKKGMHLDQFCLRNRMVPIVFAYEPKKSQISHLNI